MPLIDCQHEDRDICMCSLEYHVCLRVFHTVYQLISAGMPEGPCPVNVTGLHYSFPLYFLPLCPRSMMLNTPELQGFAQAPAG